MRSPASVEVADVWMSWQEGKVCGAPVPTWSATSTVGPVAVVNSVTPYFCRSSGGEGLLKPPGISVLTRMSSDSLHSLPGLKEYIGLVSVWNFLCAWSSIAVVLKLTCEQKLPGKCLKGQSLGPNPRDDDSLALAREACESALLGSIPVFAEKAVPRCYFEKLSWISWI